MKKILTLFAAMLLLFSCGTYTALDMDNPEVAFDAGQVLSETHPELMPYYEAQVLKITSLKELQNGYEAPIYEIRYKFVKYHIHDPQERAVCLREHFPELYSMYISGGIKIWSLYRYVDDKGVIRHHVSYGPRYDFYIEHVPLFRGYHYHYRARMTPPPPPRHHPGPPRPRTKR